MRKLLCVVLFVLVSLGSAWGQWPEPPSDIHEHKAEMFWYRQLRLSEIMQTVNQEHYDVTYYGIDIDIDPDMRVVRGSVRMRAEVMDGPIDLVEVDLLGNMNVDGGIRCDFVEARDNVFKQFFINRAQGMGGNAEVFMRGVLCFCCEAFDNL